MEAPPLPPLHALLIGIDGYPEAPLAGCVNDIRAVQAFLIEKLAVPPAAIKVLLAPNAALPTPDPAPQLGQSELAPTHANLVAALKALAGPPVGRGHRVLIYYSGHGSYQKVTSAQAYFEGLVPLDFAEAGLLFDLELNRLLQAIADQAGDLSVILDCCNSGGATRALDSDEPDQRTRSLALRQAAPASAERRLHPMLSADADGATSHTPYTVLAACHADQKATECRRPPLIGRSHGLLSATLLEILGSLAGDRRPGLWGVRFCDIFPVLSARIVAANSAQHPQLLGPSERPIFGGPYEPRDPGYRVLFDSAGGYVLEAGSLAGLSRGAQLAVYGPEPARFPTLGSPADLRARLGELTISTVSPARASAIPSAGGRAFELPLGARARLIRSGELSRLRVLLRDEVDAALRARLAALQADDGFQLLAPGEPGAELIVGQTAARGLWLGDELCGPGEPAEPSAPGPLAVVPWDLAPDLLAREQALRGAIRHYGQYVVPLRAFRSGGFSLPSKPITTRIIDVSKQTNLAQLTQEQFMRTELRRGDQGHYCANIGDQIAIEVSNDLNIDLFANLFLCTCDGFVELLALDTLLPRKSRVLFWLDGIDGEPFPAALGPDHRWGIERLISLVTDQPGLDFTMLKLEQSMADAIRDAIELRNLRPLARKFEGVRWVAQQTLLQIGEP